MKKVTGPVTLCLSLAFAVNLSIQARSLRLGVNSGSAPRTFVSFSGLDTNPCSRTSPCRSFNAAMAQTAPAGTIVALDSDGYGTVTIAQSVSLIAPEGVYAGIAAPASSVGININGA